jgi:hypothetical protein
MAKDTDRHFHGRTAEEMNDFFGKSVTEGLTPTGQPIPGRSALLMAQQRVDQAREAQRARVNEQVDDLAATDATRRAYDRVMDQRDRGEPSSLHDKVLATRWARANDLLKSKSSAEKLAATYPRS